MSALEDDLESLLELDEHRVKAAEWRDQGRAALANREDSDGRRKVSWSTYETPAAEQALVYRALVCHRALDYKDEADQIISAIAAKEGKAILGSDEKDQMPILRAAREMCALAKSQESAFTRATMCMHYRLVREIYSAHAPEWVTGGIRAGEAAATTAYATGESVRAILALRRALERRAAYMEAVAALFQERDRLTLVRTQVPDWVAAEEQRVAKHFFTTFSDRRAIVPISRESSDRAPSAAASEIWTRIDGANEKLDGMLEKAKAEFETALKEIRECRDGEFPNEAAEKRTQRLNRTATAHEMGVGAVDRALATVKEAIRRIEEPPDAGSMLSKPATPRRLREVAKVFTDAAAETHRLLLPAIAYLERVLDRELALAASEDKVNCDLPELAFAAASYGAATGKWHDERLHRATIVLSKHISERGRFPLGRPLRATLNGYKAHVIGSEVIRAFSQLLENVKSVEVDAHVIKSMMMYFDDRMLTSGIWDYDDAQYSREPQRWSTAFAVLALDHINRMLDERINCRVLKQFSYRKPADLGDLRLDQVFYSDYGVAGAEKRESIAIVLERMRAHVLGLRDHFDPLGSLILHGPQGTGKTTLVEALAKTANVPLVEVTPSDIVIAGIDKVERRARDVFKALSLLTRAVVMFDEFDPVLKARDPKNSETSVFSFLTPGMLPKLKTLHDKAKARSCGYVLITNLIGSLDRAAIREGRFDLAVGIYPPDFLSRAGRFYSMVTTLGDSDRKRVFGGTDRVSIKKNRSAAAILDVLKRTGGVSMNTLAKPEWYSAPRRRRLRLPVGTPYARVFEEGDFTCHELDAVPEETRSNDEAIRGYYEWRWVRLWDARVKSKVVTTLRQALDARPKEIPVPINAFDKASAPDPAAPTQKSSTRMRSVMGPR